MVSIGDTTYTSFMKEEVTGYSDCYKSFDLKMIITTQFAFIIYQWGKHFRDCYYFIYVLSW